MHRPGTTPTVVLLVIDGLRPDAITEARMPALAALREQHWSATAETVTPSATIAALTSLATGVAPATHGVTEASIRALAHLRQCTPLPAHLRRHGIPTRVVLGEMAAPELLLARLLAGAGGVAAFLAGGSDPGTIGVRGATLGRREPGGLIVVYLSDCDRAGHAAGWMSEGYLAAAARCDAAVSHLATLLDDPGAVLCVTADHGGGGVTPTDHDLPHPVNAAIPLVIARAGAPVPRAPERRPTLLDLPPTLAALLGAPVPQGYEGRILLEALEGASIAA